MRSSLAGMFGLSVLPVQELFARSSSAPEKSGVTIKDIKIYHFKKAVFARVISSEGISGWGECDAANKPYIEQHVETRIKPYFVGKDPFNSDGLWHDAYLREIETGMSGIHPGTLAGIDNALWDLKGKLVNLPAHKLMGGNGKTKIQVYASYGRDGDNGKMTPAEMASIAAGFVNEGYKAVKVRLQIRQFNVNPYPDDNFKVVEAVRKAVGDDIVLFVDFNNGYTPAEAIVQVNRMYEKLNITAVEEPVFQQDYQGLRQVVDAVDIPVLAGEHEYTKWMFKDLLQVANVDVFNTDVILCGLSECQKIASMAHAFGKQIMVHNAKPTLATAASVQLLASINNAANFQEYAGKREHQGYGSLQDLFENYFEFADGFITVPSHPGLGLVVNEKAMEKNKI